MIDFDKIKFDEKGLVPAIVVDAKTGGVLMLAYMNAESLQISLQEGRACFWSRSRKKLWRKGETSGNVLHIISIKADCDMDTLLIAVRRDGPACHTGADSCFFEQLYASGTEQEPEIAEAFSRAKEFSLGALHSIISDRKENPKPGSYTNYLFDKGIDKMLKKLGEETAEVIIASKGGSRSNTVYELADLAYHAFVLMTQMGIDPSEVLAELASRHSPREEG